MTEDVLISIATGERPFTAEIALKALTLAIRELKSSRPNTAVTVHLGVWDGKTPSYLPVADEVRVFELRHGVKPEILNKSLELYGEPPRYWVTMDDDVVLGFKTLPEMLKLAEQYPEFGLWGAWNDESEQDRGAVQSMSGHQVQWDLNGYPPFCVGGAFHLIPRTTVERVGVYPEDRPRHEDAEYSSQVRAAGLRAVLVRSLAVSVLPNDRVIEGYRDRILAMHYGSYDPRNNRRAGSEDRRGGADEGSSGPDDGSARGPA